MIEGLKEDGTGDKFQGNKTLNMAAPVIIIPSTGVY